MKKVAKVLAWLFAATLFTVVAVIVYVTLVIDPNEYKQDITELVKRHTGRELSINGNMSFTFFPWLGVRADSIELSNTPKFDESAMLSVEQAEVQVRLIPLLQKKLQIDTVVLRNPVMHLVVDPNGTTNWEDLYQALAQTERGDTESSDSMGTLAIKGFDLTDGALTWEDQRAPSVYTFSEVNIQTSELIDQRPIEVKLDFAVDSETLEQSVNVRAKAKLKLGLTSGVHEFIEADVQTSYGAIGMLSAEVSGAFYDQNKMNVTIDSAVVQGEYTPAKPDKPVSAAINSRIAVDLDKAGLYLKDTQAQIDFGSGTNAKFIIGNLSYSETDALVSADDVTIEAQHNKHDARATLAKVTGNLQAQSLDIPSASVIVDDVATNLTLKVSDYLDGVRYGGRLDTKAFEPAQVIQKLGLEWQNQDPNVLKQAQISTRFEGTDTQIEFDQLVVNLDETSAQGSITIENFNHPKYRFTLQIDRLDVDRYTPKQTTPPQETGAAILVFPVGLFRGLDVDGQLRVSELRVSGINMTDIEVGIASTEVGTNVKPMKAQLYGGTLEGEMRYTEEHSRAALDVHQVMNNVEIGPLLKDTDVTDRFDGKGRLILDVETAEVDGVLGTKGSAQIRIFDGTVKGLNLRELYLQARQIYNQHRGKEQAVATDDREEFRFTELTGTLSFDERKAANDDLYVKSPLFRITGEGQANLSTNELDYLINTTVVETAKGQGGEELAELRGISIPIRVSGKLESPVYQLDVAKFIQALAQERMEREVEKLEQKLEKKIQQKLGEELKKLF